jgi:hypothetical protein
MAATAILNMSGFLLRLVRRKVPAACCEHLAGTAWLAGGAREGYLLPTPHEGVECDITGLLRWFVLACAGLRRFGLPG